MLTHSHHYEYLPPLPSLPSDIILYVSSFLDNKSNSRLISTCKCLNTHGKTYGYLTKLILDYKETYFSFIHKFYKNINTINTIEIKESVNPHILIPEYTHILIFSHCSINKYINPDNVVKTKVLKITDYHRHTNKNILRINWKCFKNLEYLELYIYDVELEGIETLEKLKYKKIDTVNKKRSYSKCINM